MRLFSTVFTSSSPSRAFRLRACTLVRILLCIGSLWSAGCALQPSPQDSLALPVPQMSGPIEESAEPIPVPADSEPAPSYPSTPPGLLDLEQVYSLLDLAMTHLAGRRWAEAEDLLFTLRESAETPLPAVADSIYAWHLASLRRRLDLLGGLLAEEYSFAPPNAGTDSLLAVHYDRLTGLTYPDSLRPFLGQYRAPLVADLLLIDNPAVQKWLNYFCGPGRSHFQTWLYKAAAADSLVTAILAEAGLPHQLIALAMIESGLNTRARSVAGAVGPWQFMDYTARELGLRQDWWVDERRDLEFSTRAAARYLVSLYAQFEDWALVLAAYNSGAGRTARAIRLKGHDNYWALHLPSQTADYVPKFIAACRIAADPAAYGFVTCELPPLAYDILPVGDATDLDLIARCAGVDASAVRSLNPALLRGASPPDSPEYPVRIPAGTLERCRRELSRVPAEDRLTWRQHRVSHGETLGQIARQYGATVEELTSLNRLRNPRLIHPGDQLLIPMPAVLAEKAQARALEKGHYVPPDGFRRVSYQVKAGDTLASIARQLGVTLAHLRKVNNIHQTSLIHPGQRLYAWRPAESG